MRLLRNLVIGLVGLVIVLAAAAFALPREVTVSRSATIAAAPAAVFPYVNSDSKFIEWSPWAAKDPAMKITHEGPVEGVGARMTWVSENDQVGTGTQEITESVPDERVAYRLEFGGMTPAAAYFDMEPAGEGTAITWTLVMDMGSNPVARWMGLMMDGWVGKDFDTGLANLKAKVEGG
jgi:uncharacterized protein YndB with AHSA1/START domain